jgi:hypothetical protein
LGWLTALPYQAHAQTHNFIVRLATAAIHAPADPGCAQPLLQKLLLLRLLLLLPLLLLTR